MAIFRVFHPLFLFNRCRQAAVELACVVAATGAAQAQQAPPSPPPQEPAPQKMDPQVAPVLTSRNIAATGQVSATPAHPWAGFWKLSFKDEFGLALVAATPRV